MGIQAKNVKRPIGFGTDKTEMVVTKINLLPTIESDKLFEQVGLRIGRPTPVVKDVMENIIEAVMTYLSEGHGVRLGDLGIIYPAIKTSADTEEDNCKVNEVTVRMRPSNDLKAAMKGIGVSVTKLDGTQTTDTDTPDEGGTDDNPDGGVVNGGAVEF